MGRRFSKFSKKYSLFLSEASNEEIVSISKELTDELRYLREHGTEEINICLDMDYRDKPQVAKALSNIKRIIERCGLKYNMLVWPEEYKGIDDYLLSRKKDDGHNSERQNLV